MNKLVLHTQENCIPCRYVEELLEKYNIKDQVEIKINAYHPLVIKRPTMVIDDVNAVVGVISIETHIQKLLSEEK